VLHYRSLSKVKVTTVIKKHKEIDINALHIETKKEVALYLRATIEFNLALASHTTINPNILLEEVLKKCDRDEEWFSLYHTAHRQSIRDSIRGPNE